MSDDDAVRSRVDGLLDARAREHPVSAGATGALTRLCEVATADLGLQGAAVTLLPGLQTHVVAAATSPVVRELEDGQFGVGEGPTREAFLARRPVLVTDLAGAGVRRWPAWAPTALAAGACAAYAFPLHLGATRLGVLTLYRDTATRLDPEQLRTALVLAEVATLALLDVAAGGDDPADPAFSEAMETHADVYQAQGMVMVALSVGLPEALARMRAHAWAHDLDLLTLARDLVAGRTTLAADPP